MAVSMFAELSPPYSTIVADPPWAYDGKTPPWRSSSTPTYRLMPIDEIRSLAVGRLAAGDAHLYLWAVLPMMAEAYSVIEAWGFTAETVLTWCKNGPGLGGGFRGNTEHLLVARRTRGDVAGLPAWVNQRGANPTCASCGGRARGAKKCGCPSPDWRVKSKPVAAHDILTTPFRSVADGTWYLASRGEHSAKPGLFADLIERMSPGPYVELFARQPRLGWDSWGFGYEGVA